MSNSRDSILRRLHNLKIKRARIERLISLLSGKINRGVGEKPRPRQSIWRF